MTKIIASAEEFSRDICASECASARGFFGKMKREMKKARRELRFDADMRDFLRAAEASLRSLENEGVFPLYEGVPYMFRLLTAYVSSEEGAFGSSLREYLKIVSKHHDFLISETILLRDFLTVALFDSFVSADSDKKQAAAEKFDLLDYIPFDDLYIEFAKAHEIFASEKAGVYENCTADTKSYYDEMLIEKYGSDEIENAKKLVARADEEGEHVGKYLLPAPSAARGAYFWLLTVLTAGTFFISFLLSDILTALVALLPCYALSKEITLLFFERSNFFLPAIEKGDEIEKTKCVVAVATLLSGEAADGEIYDNIEDFYLSNRDGNFIFAVLGDLKEADRKRVSSDSAVIKYARSRIDALNAKYGERFALFIRRRRYAVCEKKYFGWERKRGAVLELCRYAAGEDGSFETVVGGANVRGASYLLTLDSDTRLGVSSVKKLLGVILHPQNRAKIDIKRRAVVGGYGILQPKMATSLESASRTLFASLTSGDGGVDRYSTSSFDLYQDVFGRGIFCGKGLIDISAFLAVCDGVFPKERILSHDLLEGALARAATVKRVVLTDSTPKNAVAYYSRLDRWYRGDIQALIYAGGKLRNDAGETVGDPMGILSRFQLYDNVLRAATPLFSMILFALCAYFGRYYALFPIIYILMPTLKSTAAIFRPWRQSAYSLKKLFSRTLADLAFGVGSTAARAGVFLGALSSVIGSALFTKRGFLSWTTAAQAETKAKGGIFHHILSLWFSVAVGAVFLVLPPAAKVLGAIWMLFPIVMWALGKDRRDSARLSSKNEALLRSYAADMWRFFEENVGEETNWLPPDNVQFSPVQTTAMRTSPTNVGMYFLSLLAARDLGLIDTDELYFRASAALDTLGKMEKWNGHLYNWYDVKTLAVIGVPFVSSVDSGNFVTALVAFAEGIKEYVPENPTLVGLIGSMVNYIYCADFEKLMNKERGFLSIGFNVSTGELSNSCYDTLMSESRTTSYFLAATGRVPSGYYHSLGRRLVSRGARVGAASWSGTAFEFFMPSLLIRDPENSFSANALDYAYATEQRRACAVPGKSFSVFGVSESCFFEFDKDMNYQYRAYGLAELSLDPKTRDERVVSPYSSFLMLKNNVPRVISNLEKLKQVGMYGRYGFYEALDVEPSRVGGGYAVIKSYMSHHVGMSIVAVANTCLDDVFIRRFMREANMRACRGLLGEKMPTSAGGTIRKEKKKAAVKPIAPRGSEREIIKKRPPTLLHPDVFMLSNNKTRVVASSSGQIAIFDGADAVVSSPFERLSLGGGMQFYADIGGKIISAVPLGYVSDGVRPTFDFFFDDEKVIYRSNHVIGDKKVRFDVAIRLYENDETIEIGYKLSGDVSGSRMLLYFEPIIDDARAFGSHKSFSNLFIESKFHPDERVLVFARRPRIDGKPFKYLGIYADPPMSETDFETRREEVLPLMYGARDVASLIRKNFDGRTGAVIVPACVLRSVGAGGRVRRATFRIGCSQSCDDLLYAVSMARGGEYTGKIAELQRASSGAGETVRALERELLYRMMFAPSKRKRQGEALLRALAKKPVRSDGLWRHGISGNMHIVSAAVGEMKNEATARLLTTLRLFKYSCVRSLRFDLVIIFHESDAYNESVKRAIEGLISGVGLSAFVGCDGGIFVLENESLTDGERFLLTECATLSFDLTSSYGFDVGNDNGVFELSENVTDRLLREPSVDICDIPLPERFSDAEKTLGGYAAQNGFIIEKGCAHAPWAHVIASRCFGTVLTENSLGFTFFSNAALGKLTPHRADNMREDDGEKIVIRVYDDGGDYSDYDAAACSKYVFYSDGAAEYYGKADEIGFVLKVSLGGRFPAKRVEVLLSSNIKAKVKIIYLLKNSLGFSPQGRMRAVISDAENKCVSVMPLYAPDGRAVRSVLTLKDGGCGYYEDEASLRTDKAVFGGEEIACVYDEVTFSSEHRSEFFLFHSESDELKRFITTALTNRGVPSEKACVTPTVRTGNAKLDGSVNFWLPYQTISSRLFARAGFYQVGGAYGYRDQLQDVISLITFAPRLAREHILRAAARQYEDGSVMHWWHDFGSFRAGIRSRISDDSAWLALTLSEYVKKTGDSSVLDVKTPYLSSPPLSKEESERYESVFFSDKKETVLGHAARGLIRTFRTGEHGLPLIGTGDWNDGMNCVGRRGKGESVWLAFFSAICAERLASLCKMRGMNDVVHELTRASRRLIDAAKDAFDGEWFIRGYYDSGEKLGARGCGECVIDVMPQAFAAVAASEVDATLADDARCSLTAAYGILFDRDNSVFRLLRPPFDRGDQSPGYIKGYVPGIRENGGQYTHAAVFAALGMFRVGMNREATELLFAINPILRESPRYKIEPYVLAGDVYSNPACAGRGGWSWYTGAAGWYRTVFIEELCGYRQRGEEFSIRPRLNSLFPSFEMDVRRGETHYVVRASMAESDFAVLDGKASENRFFFDGREHFVEIFARGGDFMP